MLLVAGAMERCCEQPEHEKWVPLFKIQVFFSCVSFSIIVPSLANYLRRMGAEEWVLGVAVAVYSLGEMVGSAVFGKIITKRLREQPATGPRRALLETMVFGVLPIAAHGTAEQKQALLPKLATGELIATAALLEELREPTEPGLVARADAVIENQATGVMAKLGLSYDELRAANPSIIMMSLPAFGAAGPWSGYRGYGSTVEHGAGLPYLTGDEGGPPIQTHSALGDAYAGLNAMGALLVALFHRKRTGEGQYVEFSQVECMLQQGVHGTIAQGLTGAPPERTGNRHPAFVPHGCFACAAPDSWLVVAVTEDAQWPKLCTVIGRDDLSARADLHAADGRRAIESEIEAAISAWTTTQGADAAMVTLQNAGVPAGVTRRPTDLLDDPHYAERGFWQEIDRAVVGPKPHPLTPWRFDGERGPLRTPAPLLGEYNRAVFCGILGMSDAEFAALVAADVIGDQPMVMD